MDYWFKRSKKMSAPPKGSQKYKSNCQYQPNDIPYIVTKLIGREGSADKTTVHYIRELYFLEGKTISEISAMTEHNYRTIKKYLEMDDFSPSHHKANRSNKSDTLRPIISQWLTEDKSRHHKQRHTAKRIYERLKEEYPDLLQVGARRVRDLVKEEKKKVFGQDEAYLRLHHPGGEAQVDFGSLEAFENGSLKKFHELIVSFPKSNAGFAVVTRSETREALMEGLISLFRFIGYVPSSIVAPSDVYGSS